MIKYFKLFKLTTRHKWCVFKACCKAGIVWRGLMHDNSKYSPSEFFEYSKYYTGKGSPVDECKRVNGNCKAWQHHKGRNPHHWEYWVDNLSCGGEGTVIPYKYAVEMICDIIGAGQSYDKEKWDFECPYIYWSKNIKGKAILHPAMEEFFDIIFWTLKEEGSYNALSSEYMKSVYHHCLDKINV